MPTCAGGCGWPWPGLGDPPAWWVCLRCYRDSIREREQGKVTAAARIAKLDPPKPPEAA